jgi:uncharacterized OsmC-like protein
MIELVWDAGRIGTARTSSGLTLAVGPEDLPPADLLGAAAAGCLMQAFLDAAGEAGIDILGYMATADVESASGSDRPIVRLHSYVVVPTAVTESQIARLADVARSRSSVARLLGDRCVADWSLRAVHGVGEQAKS